MNNIVQLQKGERNYESKNTVMRMLKPVISSLPDAKILFDFDCRDITTNDFRTIPKNPKIFLLDEDAIEDSDVINIIEYSPNNFILDIEKMKRYFVNKPIFPKH